MTFPAQPHISVVLPVKNGWPHVQNALSGLLSQTYRNFTLVVQDSASTDGTLDYFRNLDPFFKIDLVSEPDACLAQGYARACRRVKGDLMVIGACDEILDPNALETYVGWYKDDPQATYIYGGSRIITDTPEYGRITRPYQPLVFNLGEYVRFRMCPTTAGAFNKHKLGDALYFDDSLKTCPDFELTTRLALLFGEENFIAKQAITMSALGDNTSMVMRPESHAQFARDKAVSMERMLTGPLAGAFRKYMEGDLVYGLHYASAMMIYDTAGDIEAYADHLVAADEAMPGRPAMKQLIGQSRYLYWDKEARRVRKHAITAPATPPNPQGQPLLKLNLQNMNIAPAWAALGASRQSLPNGSVNIQTTLTESFSAMMPIDLRELDFEKNWYWLKLECQVTKGMAKIILADFQDGNSERKISYQTKVVPTPGIETHFIYLKPAITAALIIANTGAIMVGHEDKNIQSFLQIHSLSLMSAPRPAAGVAA